MKVPSVAIVGRPNVGKSTLFNRVAGRRRAIVEPTPGVTRDRNYDLADWRGRSFQLIDTGGYDVSSVDPLRTQIRKAAERAVEEADVVIFLLDGKEGLHPLDPEVFRFLRKSSRPVLVAVNKIDNRKALENLPEFYQLGSDVIFPVSAEHGDAVGDLLDAVVRRFPDRKTDDDATAPEEEPRLMVAIVGRPNVGKSTLANYLIGENRMIVDSRPGTTRDPIDTHTQIRRGREVQDLTLIDMAGIRRRARITDTLERYSVFHSFKAIKRADIALLLIDASESLEFTEDTARIQLKAQDARLAEYIHRNGKGLILLLNKWDLVEKAVKGKKIITGGGIFRDRWFDFSSWLPVSALTGKGVDRIVDYLFAYRRSAVKVATSRLNEVIQQAVKRHTPPVFRGREVKFFYATQTLSAPPTFLVFVNFPRGIDESYRRYLLNCIREEIGVRGVPIRVRFRKKT